LKTIEILIKKEIGNKSYTLTRICNSNGHSYFQFRINGIVRWCYKAYEYEADGITSHEVKAPFGLSNAEYEKALTSIMSYFKVA
jgi:hypothetical protein